jgi:hypothetical protein
VVAAAGKRGNSADLYMSIEMMDTLASYNYDLYVVGSGDGDFLPAVTKLREHGKHVIGLGIEKATNSLLRNTCDDYIFYEDIIGLPKSKQTTRKSRSQHQNKEAERNASLREQLKQALKNSGKWENGAKLANKLRHNNSAFDRDMEQAGVASLRELLEDNDDLVEIRFVSPTQMEVRLKVSDDAALTKPNNLKKLIVAPPEVITVDYYVEILARKKLRFVVPTRLRPGIIYQAYNLVESSEASTFNELRQKILEPARKLADKNSIVLDDKAVNNIMVQLFQASCFEFDQATDKELWDRPFYLRRSSITSQRELLTQCDMHMLRQVDSALPDDLDLDPEITIQLLYGDDDREVVMQHTIGLINAIQME